MRQVLKKEVSFMVAMLIVTDDLDELREALERALREMVEAERGRGSLRSAAPFETVGHRIPLRAGNALRMMGAKTIGDLYNHGPADLLNVEGAGPKILNSVVASLRQFVDEGLLDADKLAHWFI